MKRVVIVGRQWHRPEITVIVTDEKIGVQMTLDDFMKAVAAEIGADQDLQNKLQAAGQTVVGGMKQETTRVM